jgi:hypothetical protein
VDSVGFVPHGAGVMDYFDHVSKSTTWEVLDVDKEPKYSGHTLRRTVTFGGEGESIEPIVIETEISDEEAEDFRKLVAERYLREGCL